ncbi:MAG: ATP phosphoribosyltransferase [Agrococcus casei]|uniref:ATP phosphoribosyltransferase n=1 Tax=Agrococcus casei TaxID=343512 RepID=UPI003F98277E
MLKIAVPNKGALSETAAAMLAEAGYRGRRDSKELTVTDVENDVEFFYLRPRDIATYVGSGALDVGITGRDLFLDSGSPAIELKELGFARSTFRFAGPVGRFSSLADLEGMRIASSYTRLVDEALATAGVNATSVHLDGAVESSVKLGVADAVADVVETGTTLRTQGLEPFGDAILSSEAILIGSGVEAPGLAKLRRRLNGVLVARRYVLLDYDVHRDSLDETVRVASGMESPTVSPLHDPDWVAVRVMVESSRTNEIMDALAEAGARAILVTNIVAARI